MHWDNQLDYHADRHERIRQINNSRLTCNIPQCISQSPNSFIFAHQSFTERTRFRGSGRKNVINKIEKGMRKKRYFAFREEKERTETERGGTVHSKENLSAIFLDRTTSASRNVDFCRFLLIIGAQLRVPVSTREPKIHAGSFSCRGAIATCDHSPMFSWRSHIAASRARHACNFLFSVSLLFFFFITVIDRSVCEPTN